MHAYLQFRIELSSFVPPKYMFCINDFVLVIFKIRNEILVLGHALSEFATVSNSIVVMAEMIGHSVAVN